MTRLRAGVVGATGYTGAELIGLLAEHPGVTIAWATSRSAGGKSLDEVMPGAPSVRLVSPDDMDFAAVDVVFLCLPHGAAAPTAAAAMAAGVSVIDLSADFRLRDPARYAAWYATDHPEPALLDQAVYGLTEFARQDLPGARLVANPGCYPTSILLALAPLLVDGHGDDRIRGPLIADSKSGVSGAGRVPALQSSFVEVAEDFKAYKVGRAHRHLPEMEQQLASWWTASSAGPPAMVFTPHLLPVSRGILSTIYVPLRDSAADERALRARYAAVYAAEPFITVLKQGEEPTLRHVTRTNRCVLALDRVETADGPLLILRAAIDNLVKGAAGQAVQNMNVVFGLGETEGLR